MAVLPILQWPDPRLKAVCAPVTGSAEELAARGADMLETMYAAPGRGLAGPQVGVMQRIFVMDAGWKAGAPRPRICLDPVIEPLGTAEASGEEACLSIPGQAVTMTRAARVRLTYRTPEGATVAVELAGAEAVIAQHEADHLDGKLIID